MTYLLKYAIFVILFMIIIFLLFQITGEKKNDVIPDKEIKRVVSLSPSITRQIADLGIEKRLVGVTSYHPPLENEVKIIGTLNNPNIELIFMLKPDIVLFSEEDSATQNIERLFSTGIDSYMFKRNVNFDSICENYLVLGKIFNREKLSQSRLMKYRSLLKQNKHDKQDIQNLKIAFFISTRPLITASGSSYIGNIIKDAGGINIYNDLRHPYPIITIESIIKLNPDVIISMTDNTNEFFKNILNDFNIKALKRDSIYSIDPENISHYTPDDYVKSVVIISNVLKKERARPPGNPNEKNL